MRLSTVIVGLTGLIVAGCSVNFQTDPYEHLIPEKENAVEATPIVHDAIFSSFPPRVVFAGIQSWDRIVDLSERPFIFITDFETNLKSFKSSEQSINFGLLLTDSEVKDLAILKPESVNTVINKYQERFQERVQDSLKFCISFKKVDATVESILCQHGIAYFNPVAWSKANDSKLIKYPYLYVHVDYSNDTTILDHFERYSKHSRKYKRRCCCCIC